MSYQIKGGGGAVCVVGGLRPLVAYFCHALENLGVSVPLHVRAGTVWFYSAHPDTT